MIVIWLAAGVTAQGVTAPVEIPSVNLVRLIGGGGASAKKKKAKKAEIVEEVAEVVAEAIPQAPADESRQIAMRLAEQMTVRQLREIQTIDALIARVEAEIAEMDDEEVLLLAA